MWQFLVGLLQWITRIWPKSAVVSYAVFLIQGKKNLLQGNMVGIQMSLHTCSEVKKKKKILLMAVPSSILFLLSMKIFTHGCPRAVYPQTWVKLKFRRSEIRKRNQKLCLVWPGVGVITLERFHIKCQHWTENIPFHQEMKALLQQWRVSAMASLTS